jgi:hypothetical protein
VQRIRRRCGVSLTFSLDDKMKNKTIILIHALIGWILCGMIIGIGRSITSLKITLIIHAILVPIIFAGLSYFYFNKFNRYSPFKTASFFFVFAASMDFFIVALLIEKNMSMFASVLGTWIPFLSIFLVTWLTGRLMNKTSNEVAAPDAA